jgi:protein-disulfide isomerase
LDRARFDADANSAATKAKVDVDVALGKELKIKGTPTAFLNNKLLSARAMSLLDRLVEHEGGQDHE